MKKRGEKYEAFKHRLGERMWQQTCSLLPQLQDKVGLRLVLPMKESEEGNSVISITSVHDSVVILGPNSIS